MSLRRFATHTELQEQLGPAVASVPRESDSVDTSPLSRVQLLHLDDAAITAALPTKPETTTDNGKAA